MDPTTARSPSLPRPRALSLILFAGLILALSWGGVALTWGDGPVAALWLPNAVLAAFLLRHGLRRGRIWIGAAFAGYLAASLLNGNPPWPGGLVGCVLMAMMNCVEAVGGSWLLLRWLKRAPDMTDFGDLARFALCCGVISPGLCGLAAGTWMAVGGTGPDLHIWQSWSLADGLGVLIVCPVLLLALDAWSNRGEIDRCRISEIALILAANAALAMIVFGQTRFPLLFVALPMVVVTAFRLGVAGTAAAVTILSVIATAATLNGNGPMLLVAGSLETRIHLLQLFLATAFGIGVPVASALAGRDRARADLKRARDFSDTLVATMQEVVFRTDATGRWIFLNPAWEKLTGYTVAESIGQRTDKLLHPEDRAHAHRHYPAIVTGALNEAAMRQRFHDKDGVCRHIEVTLRRLTTPEGAFDGTIGTIRDISEQVAAQDELAESKRLFKALADLSPTGIFRTDLRGDVTYVNVAWTTCSGLAYEEAMGWGWTAAIHPEDRAHLSGQWAQIVSTSESAPTSGELRTEFRFRHRDGTVRWVEVITAREYNAAGEQIGFIGVNIDVTERKAAEAALAEREEQLRLLAENATDAVFRLALDGTCLYASPSVGEMIGVAPHRLIGRNLLDRFHPDDRARVLAAHRDLAQGGSERLVIAYRFEPVDRPGQWIWLEANSGLVRDTATRSPREIICSVRDISVHKQLELDIDAARRHAEVAAQAKSSFLANMSHEIRTPMNGVLGFTELLLAEQPRADQREKLQMIADSGEAMMRLLNDILDLSKIEAGHVTLSQERVDLRRLADTCAQLIKPLTMRAGIDLRVDVAADVPARVIGDGLRLRQIVLNLLGNAAKFTAAGSIVLRVAATADDLAISVGDTGVGIAPDRQAAIFGEFVQADTATTRDYGGTGLGLSISTELAKLMGGALSLFSAVGVGTTVTLRVPLTLAPAQDAATAVDEILRPLPAVAGARVLVAEDYAVNQLLIKAMLTRLGYVPEIARNGIEAIALVEAAVARGTPYGLVLMDMQMPDMNGIDATRRLRADGHGPATLPIVALTANAYAGDVDACRAAGMQDHLAKPVQLAALDRIVRCWAAPPRDMVPSRTPAVPAPTVPAADPDLIAGFDARAQALFALLDRLLADGHPTPAAIDGLRTLLHQVAGVAGFFGKAALGTKAADVNDQLGDGGNATPEFLDGARSALRRAAAGGR